MDANRPLTTNAVGFYLLPSELIEDILLRLALPDILRFKCISKSITTVIRSNDFRHHFNLRSALDTWLFVYQKRSSRESVLYGFTDRSNRWFKIPVAHLLFPVVPPGEDLYFLTASGGFFLFASNNCRELIVVNLTSKAVIKIPTSPLGPRDTSSWRRSGLKLISGPPGSDSFRFLFAELYDNRLVVFEYTSDTNTWRCHQAQESEQVEEYSRDESRELCLKDKVFLSVVHRRNDSVILATEANQETPIILRPRFEGGAMEERVTIGFCRGNELNRLHVYGDDCVVIVRSEGNEKLRRVRCIEVWGFGVGGRRWELVSRAPEGVVEKVRKAYKVMMGCLEKREGRVRVVLVTNYEGVWDLIWLCYDMGSKEWSWVPLPEFRTKGLNMAGVTLSSGLTL